ncbi:hypothetical protein A6M27_10365 [Acidithiobacillus thiooxidans]|jgi:uncharacterized protein YbjQ (UPF0145 family)|uniref:YbjQ family protein n=1 Tax=Acidithiobacillus thiooxidans TaxID=930 RepID=UPI000465E7C6|nr:YbjQ family protein [Acidithiobacillus thiooxidans]OCX68009.1 hypothetical protein A6O24_20255 [Acidithiobacillus thiooxidans]OCX83707.1 hypothetical protein A6O26_06340 [Acidithiobacillus thiooxidans]OCX87643.1 hypothetical protein A6M27_10365 [Acidithiobacillus thiooxidans]OFC43648.1 hypothetical protein BAE47_12785 [Acidithiobacillus thiooxidans]
MASNTPVLILTTNDCPGYTVQEIIGPVFGISVRSRNAVGNMLGNLSQSFGGEQKGYIKLASDARDSAIEQLTQAARTLGANAVLAMRFDSDQLGNEKGTALNEVVAYGTAVVLAGL